MTETQDSTSGERALKIGVNLFIAIALVLIVGTGVREALARDADQARHAYLVKAARHGISAERIRAMMERAGPAAMAIADRHNPDRYFEPRTAGWAQLDINNAPRMDFGQLTPERAYRINAVIPVSDAPNPPAPPFILRASAPERQRAIQCLTAAIYYEAANEPLEGRQAVAQVVLNRMRHDGYPKSVCGVVFQGTDLITGCQFTFTCDGSMFRPPMTSAWKQDEEIAARALSGFVMKTVGSATHYHTVWISPYWAPTLVKVARIGAHIFYRGPGPAGSVQALTRSYLGGEFGVTKANWIGKSPPMGMFADPVASGDRNLSPDLQRLAAGFQAVNNPTVNIADGRVHAILNLPTLSPAGAANIRANPGRVAALMGEPPMHAMIALRARAARAIRAEAAAQAAAARQESGEGAAHAGVVSMPVTEINVPNAASTSR